MTAISQRPKGKHTTTGSGGCHNPVVGCKLTIGCDRMPNKVAAVRLREARPTSLAGAGAGLGLGLG
jgi:hypothetical protein